MFRRHAPSALLATVLAATVIVAACDRRDPVAPNSPASQQLAKSTGTDSSTSPTTPSKPTSGTPADTAPHASPPNTPPAPDSAAAPYHGTVVLHVQVVARYPAPAGATSDTLVYQAVSGISVSIVSTTTGQTVATGITDSGGSMTASIPSGAYEITARPATQSSADSASIQVVAGVATEYVQLILPSAP